MADVENSQEILKVLIPTVSALLVPFLSSLLPRLWQDDLRQLQLESETRVKRFEAVEKGLSIVTRAKTELGIEISTHDLQSELQRIVHELADPVVLSREALEDWAKKSFQLRLLSVRPRFTVPIEYARFLRRRRWANSFILLLLFLWGPLYIYTQRYEYLRHYVPPWSGTVGYVYLSLLYIGNLLRTYRAHREALKILRGIPESRIAEVASRPLVVESLRDAAADEVPMRSSQKS